MASNSIDMISILESKFGDKIQIQKGIDGAAAIIAQNGLHRDVFQAMNAADEKTGITAISGLDLGATFGVYYHCHTSGDYYTIKANVPKADPKIATLTDIHPGALFHELEVSDLFGVIFIGNEPKGHFVLSENWPDGVYPLRKDVDPTKVKLVPAPEREANTPGEGRQVKNHHRPPTPSAVGT